MLFPVVKGFHPSDRSSMSYSQLMIYSRSFREDLYDGVARVPGWEPYDLRDEPP